MTHTLKPWTSVVRTFLKEDLAILKAGGKFIDRHGNDLTDHMIKTLEARIESSEIAVEEALKLP